MNPIFARLSEDFPTEFGLPKIAPPEPLGVDVIRDVFVAATEVLPPITDDDCRVILQDWDESDADQQTAMRLAAELLIARRALRAYDHWNYEVQSARVNGESVYSHAELQEMREKAVAMGRAALARIGGAK